METGYLFPLFVIITVLAFYFGLMAWLALLVGHWFWSWGVIALMLSPFFTLFKKAQRENVRRWWDANFGEPFEWNIEKSLPEYLALLNKQEKKHGNSS